MSDFQTEMNRVVQGFVGQNTELARRARREGFRDMFINPSDIGGRYSALSFFGLVPAALMGQDVTAIVAWALNIGPVLPVVLAASAALLMAGDPRRVIWTRNSDRS